MKLKYKETVGDLVVEYELEGNTDEIVKTFKSLISDAPQVSVDYSRNDNIDAILNSVLYNTRKGGVHTCSLYLKPCLMVV